MSIPSQEIERHCIAGALRHPSVVAEIGQNVKEDDFGTPCHRVIYATIVDALKKDEDVSSFRVAEKINNAGITLPQIDVSALEYLNDVKLIPITESATLQAFKDLRKISMRRVLYRVGQSIQQAMKTNGNSSADEIIREFDALCATTSAVFESAGDKFFEDIFEDMEPVIEQRGNNPVDEYGIMGPFPRINEIYGSLLRRGNINLVAARQNQGKTQLGQYYMMHAASTYGVPILHLDMGEMSKFELQVRAMSLLTAGRITPDMLETGSWRKNADTEAIVRGMWPKVGELIKSYYYQDVSDMTPDQIIALCRRFYLSKVKSRKKSLPDGLEFVIFYDYLKAFEKNSSGNSRYTQEYQAMGYFVQAIKSAIQKNLPTALWTSLQVNRVGISGNKKRDDIDDTENVFGLSDRIIQQATHAWLLRRMTVEELAMEPNMGNYKLIPRKARHLGKDRDAHNRAVRMPDGTYKDNYIYLQGDNFCWREIGDLGTLKDQIGVIMPDDGEDGEDGAKGSGRKLTFRKTHNKENVDI